MGAGLIADVAGQSVVPGAGLESLYAAVALGMSFEVSSHGQATDLPCSIVPAWSNLVIWKASPAPWAGVAPPTTMKANKKADVPANVRF
jgi:hypothetical protein